MPTMPAAWYIVSTVSQETCLCAHRHETEKKDLSDQLSKTMKLFQEQLAHTIKMAAMLQAQRIMTGGPVADAPQLPSMPLPQVPLQGC